MSKKYKLKYNRIRVIIIAFFNVLTVMVILRNAPVNQMFIPSLSIKIDYLSILKIHNGLLILIIAIWMNVRFVKKLKHARVLVGVIQLIFLVYVTRNLYLSFMYFGLMVESYLKCVVAFIALSVLIYHTHFSKHANSYFEKID